MNEQTSPIPTPRLALAAAIPAILFCILLYDNVFGLIPLGINVPLYLAAFYLSLFIAFGKRFAGGMKQTILHLVFIALLSVPFALSNNPILLTINAILIILLVGEQVLLAFYKTLYDPYSIRAIGDSMAFWFSFSFGGLPGSFSQYKSKGKSRFTGILIGLALTVLALLAVIPLLLSGDAVFHRFFVDLFGQLNWNDIVGNILVALALFLLGSGLLWSLAEKKRTRPAAPAVPLTKQPAAFNQTASFILLTALGGVLLVFCMIQFLYLFSGRVPEGLTYADYARSGFWQLLAVAVIVMTIVFLLLKFGAPCTSRQLLARRILMALLLACTLVLLVSSFARMTLYEKSFGFSRLRLFTQFFMVALFVFLVISIVRLWIPRLKLAKGAFLCFLLCYAALSFWNIDGFIARENVHNQGAGADIAYLVTLGPDALPYYIDLLDPADFEVAVVLEEGYAFPEGEDAPGYLYLGNGKLLLYQNDDVMQESYFLNRILQDLDTSDDWRYLNDGRSRARTTFEAHPELVQNIEAIRDIFGQS